jgi:predicted methyltransferase
MKLALFSAVALIALSVPAAAQTVSAPIKAAVADTGRPATDTERDAARHPGEILSFVGVKPGDKVGDFVMGGGYWTRILSKTVGTKGKVFAYQPEEFIKFNADYGVQQKAVTDAYPNVTGSSVSLAAFSFPEPLDAIVTVQNWHDMHLKFAPAGFSNVVAKKLYDSLKPGGVLLVVDHVANADPEFTAPQALHRIDPAAARGEIEKAGFKFEGSLPLLANPADPHTASVFDPSIKGKTDQFIFKFRKPK